MEEKKQSNLKVIHLNKKKEEMRQGDEYLSDEEIDLNIKIDTMEHLLNACDTIVEDIHVLEKKLGSGETSEFFARFLANWDATLGVFNDYYENS